MSQPLSESVYAGSIVWSMRNSRWLITVSHWRHGAVYIEEIFHATTLNRYLESAGAQSPIVSLIAAQRACVVSMIDPSSKHGQSKLLLTVLRRSYPTHKGSVITWNIRRGK